MKKRFLLICLALTVLLPSVTYSQDSLFIWATVSYEQRIFDQNFYSIPTIFKIQALTEIENYTSGIVYVASNITGQLPMANQGQWGTGTGFVLDYILPEDGIFNIKDYETTYTFSIDGSNQTKGVIVGSNTMIKDFGHAIPTFHDDGLVTWNEVVGATSYRVKIYELLPNVPPGTGPELYSSEQLYNREHFFPPTNLDPGDYVYVVEARIDDFSGGGIWVNRSMYFTQVQVRLWPLSCIMPLLLSN